MPYDKFKREDRWCVAKVDAEGAPAETVECYTSEADADRLLAALRINVEAGEAKQDSRENDPEYYAIIPDPDLKSTWKLPLMNFGDVSNAIQALSPAGFRGNRVEIPRGVSRQSVIDKLNRRIGDVQASDDAKEQLRERLRAIKALAEFRATLRTILKGAGDHMVLITSNSYEDRDQEWITTKALNRYVDNCWDGDQFVGDNVLLFEHKGPPIGDIMYADMFGPFLLEIAKARPTWYAQRKWQMIKSQPGVWGASHGFEFLVSTKNDSVYHQIYKFESTALPLAKASNVLTLAEVIA